MELLDIEYHLSGLETPDFDTRIVRTRDNPAIPRIQVEGPHEILMSVQGLQAGSSHGIPDTDILVVTSADDRLRILAELDAG